MKRCVALCGILVLLFAGLLASCGDSLWGDYDNPLDPENEDSNGPGDYPGDDPGDDPADDDSIFVISGLNSPYGLILDSSGRFYISQQWDNDVLCFDTATGDSKIFAGVSGASGYSGDGGAAASALLNNPKGIAFDSSGRLYIADTNNSCVRRVDTAGNISTVAGVYAALMHSGDGGLATAAGLIYPNDVAVGPDDSLYICDRDDYVVRRVDASTGIITTYAGTSYMSGYGGDGGPATAATLTLGRGTQDAGGGIDVDSGGNLYIADTGNHVIRMVDTGGFISTVVGNGTTINGTTEGPATSVSLQLPTDVLVADDGTIYIADSYLTTVTEYDETAGTWNTWDVYQGRVCAVSGGQLENLLISPSDSASELYYFTPASLALGPDGTLYVTDMYRGRVIRVDK